MFVEPPNLPTTRSTLIANLIDQIVEGLRSPPPPPPLASWFGFSIRHASKAFETSVQLKFYCHVPLFMVSHNSSSHVRKVMSSPLTVWCFLRKNRSTWCKIDHKLCELWYWLMVGEYKESVSQWLLAILREIILEQNSHVLYPFQQKKVKCLDLQCSILSLTSRFSKPN